jgi:hypothetical protein
MGIDADSKLAEYARLLAAWPGLVGRGEDPAALIEDSLTLLPHLDGVSTLVDVGSGGGMPGIPLLLARPELAVTLIEADHQKAAAARATASSWGVCKRFATADAALSNRVIVKSATSRNENGNSCSSLELSIKRCQTPATLA